MPDTEAKTTRHARRPKTWIVPVVIVFVLPVCLAILMLWRPRDEAESKFTRFTQAIVISAISEYHTARGEYPAATTVADLLITLTSPNLPQCSKVMESLRANVIPSSRDAILDGWGRPMRYSRDRGFGGGPVLISAGPDGDFETDADNIRSDK